VCIKKYNSLRAEHRLK